MTPKKKQKNSRLKFADGRDLKLKETHMKKILFLIAVLVSTLGHANAQTKEGTAAETKGSPPVLIDVWSPETLKTGAVWRIYLEAEDPDGDLKDIAAEISYAPAAYSKFYFAPIKEEQRQRVKGYIFTRTAISTQLIGERFRLKLAVRDQNDAKSEVVEVILKFSRKPGEELPAKWQDVADNKLGGIFPDVFRDVARKMESPTAR